MVAMTPRPAFMPLFEVATTGRVREWCWSMNKSCLRMLKTQRQLQVRVSGGDGGESNSPSRRHPGRIYYKLVRYFESRPLKLLPAEPPRAQPKVLRRSLIGVGTAALRTFGACSQPPESVGADVAALFRQLVRVLYRLLLFATFLRGRWRLGLQFSRVFPCRTRSSPHT